MGVLHNLEEKKNNTLSELLSENCSLLGTDNVRGQISEHIFEWRLLFIYSTRARDSLDIHHENTKECQCYHVYLLSVFICTVQVIKYQCIPQQHAKHCGINNTEIFLYQTMNRIQTRWMDVFLISDVGYWIIYWLFMSNTVTRWDAGYFI